MSTTGAGLACAFLAGFQSLVRVVLNEHVTDRDRPDPTDLVSIPRSGCAE